jgi:hypothetical protein
MGWVVLTEGIMGDLLTIAMKTHNTIQNPKETNNHRANQSKAKRPMHTNMI